MVNKIVRILNLNLILIIIWAGVIFYFSNQPSEISGETSSVIAELILKGTHIIDNIPQEQQEEVIYQFNGILRKIAHYTIYALGGILLHLYFKRFNINDYKKIIFSLILGVLYSVSDEIHQYFISGRSCMWQDVLLDSLGVLTGIVIMITIYKIIDMHKQKKENVLNEQ